jgi:hypothetical protein
LGVKIVPIAAETFTATYIRTTGGERTDMVVATGTSASAYATILRGIACCVRPNRAQLLYLLSFSAVEYPEQAADYYGLRQIIREMDDLQLDALLRHYAAAGSGDGPALEE